MNTEPISFYELMRASHIKRWHVINTANQQNLAEHQYNVTVIAMELAKSMNMSPSAVAVHALFHDCTEIRYGDVPTPAKAFIRKAVDGAYKGEQDADLFDYMDRHLAPVTPYTESSGKHFHDIIKMADLIEAAWWLNENGIGAHASTVCERLRRSLVELVNDLGWHSKVNPILMSLGMAHVSYEESITPP